MKSDRTVRIAGILVVLGLLGWAFVMVIWIPLYGHGKTQAFATEQEQPAVQAEIIREDRSGIRSWSIQDQQALRRLQDGLRQADYTGAKAPKADQKFRVRIRRPDSRIDEYEVLLDERGRDHDLLYVVRRADGVSVYGSAYKTPGLRAALQQILKEPSTP
jgi:hypothetical protein